MSFSSTAQISPEFFRQYAENYKSTRSADIKKLYNRLNYQPAWINKENEQNRTSLLEALKQAADKGLAEQDYNGSFIQALRKGTLPLKTIEDSLQAEMTMADAAIHFYSEIAYGSIKPSLGYDGLGYIPACRDITALVADAILTKSLVSLPGKLSPALPVIVALEKKIKSFNQVMADSSFREVTLISNKVNGSNSPLIIKLYQLGILDRNNNPLTAFLNKK
jgi:murein L,D-transpeptidase YcbB/YkuD